MTGQDGDSASAAPGVVSALRDLSNPSRQRITAAGRVSSPAGDPVGRFGRRHRFQVPRLILDLNDEADSLLLGVL